MSFPREKSAIAIEEKEQELVTHLQILRGDPNDVSKLHLRSALIAVLEALTGDESE